MTSRTTDIYCDSCGRYDHSLQPLDPIPDKFVCGSCVANGPPAVKMQRPGPTTGPRFNCPKTNLPCRNRCYVNSCAIADPAKFVETHPMDEVEALFDGGWIERYHIKGQRMLTRQSVAEHSWRIAAIIYAVNRMAREALIWAALFHDVSERVTGDMPANVKRANPEIARALNEISTAEEVRLHIRFELAPEEIRLLTWADRFEGALHCLDELEMGNRKIVATLRRYVDYCSNSDFKLEDKQNEARRQQLMENLNQRMKELL